MKVQGSKSNATEEYEQILFFFLKSGRNTKALNQQAILSRPVHKIQNVGSSVSGYAALVGVLVKCTSSKST